MTKLCDKAITTIVGLVDKQQDKEALTYKCSVIVII